MAQTRLLLFVFVLLALAVAGCVAPEKPQVDLTATGHRGGIAIQPPDGPAVPMATALAQSVVDALGRKGYQARVAKHDDRAIAVADFHVSGRAEALDAIHAPTVAALYWVLKNSAGKEIAYLTQGVRGDVDSWTYGSPAMLKIVGEEAANDFAIFIGPPPDASASRQQTPSYAPEAEGAGAMESSDAVQQQVTASGATVSGSNIPPSTSVPPPAPVTGGVRKKHDFGLWLDEVTGAPGDGNQALTQAIYADLILKKLPFAMTPGLASHYVHGIVDVDVLSATTEYVKIVWIVSNAAGEEIGRITQENQIPRGTLHGEWGDTAIYVARGGLEGVLAILERDLETSLAQ